MALNAVTIIGSHPASELSHRSRLSGKALGRLEASMTPLAIIVAIAIVVVLLSGLRIAQEYQRGVIFRLGRYVALRGPGLYWIIPLGIERAVTIDIRTRTVSAEQQETITRDSVTVKLNAVLWYRITDAAKSVIAVADAPAAVYQLALTSLRNSIGQHDLDEVLQERDKINGLLRQNIAGSTVAWGVEVERFEMKDVELPQAMQEVMAFAAAVRRVVERVAATFPILLARTVSPTAGTI